MRHIYYIPPINVKLLEDCSPNWEKTFRYAKLMEQGVEFPPVKIHYNNEKDRWCYNDGRNRVMASKLAGVPLKVKSHKRMKNANS